MGSRSWILPGAYVLAVTAACLLVWLSLGVGIIGRDGDPANRLYFAVIGVGLLGSAVARFKPSSMAFVLLAMGVVQGGIGAYAVLARLGLPWSGPLELVVLNGFFVALFVASAFLFRRAATL